MVQDPRDLGALGRQKRRSWSRRLARSRPLFKKSQSFARLFRVLSRETSRLGSILGRPDAPGLDFGGRNGVILERFRCARAVAAYIARTQQNTVKTDTNSTSELSRDKTKSMKNRSDAESDCVCRAARTPTSLWTGPGASWDRPGLALGCLPAALGSPGAPQDQLWAGICVSKTRPERIRTRARNSLGRPKWPNIDFSSILARFFADFRATFPRFSQVDGTNLALSLLLSSAPFSRCSGA